MTDSPIQVRRAELDDVQRIVRFQQDMALETEGRTLNESLVGAGVNAVFADPKKGFYLVAETGGTVVGSLLITYEWSDWRNANFWWIQSVFVDADHRRKGVYTTMHNYALREALRNNAICGVRLYVERSNLIAQQTYRSLGMRHSHYDLYEIDFVL